MIGFTALGGVLLVLWLRRSTRRSKVVADRQRTVHALKVLQSVAAADSAIPYVADGLVEVLHLRACRYEAAPAGAGGVPVLQADGHLSSSVQRHDRSGLLLPDVAHLAAPNGRFVLLGHPERGTTAEERLVAVTMVAMVAAVARTDANP